MRLDGVEVKVNLEDDQLAKAVEALDLDDRSRMTIWFCEDLTTGTRLPLLEGGVVLRVRAKGGDGGGDCTVKLRPCRRSQLTPLWLSTKTTPQLDLRVEEDWAGPRRVLAASAQVDVDKHTLDEVRSGDTPPSDLLSDDQERFLTDCAGLRVNVAATSALGPIDATRWKSVGPAPLSALGVRAERWTVAGLDFLELSTKVDPDEAEKAQSTLTSALAQLGLEASDSDTKTRRILEHLAPGH